VSYKNQLSVVGVRLQFDGVLINKGHQQKCYIMFISFIVCSSNIVSSS